jgi:hypothetical protein
LPAPLRRGWGRRRRRERTGATGRCHGA